MSGGDRVKLTDDGLATVVRWSTSTIPGAIPTTGSSKASRPKAPS